jgi:hypothetical protein
MYGALNVLGLLPMQFWSGRTVSEEHSSSNPRGLKREPPIGCACSRSNPCRPSKRSRVHDIVINDVALGSSLYESHDKAVSNDMTVPSLNDLQLRNMHMQDLLLRDTWRVVEDPTIVHPNARIHHTPGVTLTPSSAWWLDAGSDLVAAAAQQEALLREQLQSSTKVALWSRLNQWYSPEVRLEGYLWSMNQLYPVDQEERTVRIAFSLLMRESVWSTMVYGGTVLYHEPPLALVYLDLLLHALLVWPPRSRPQWWCTTVSILLKVLSAYAHSECVHFQTWHWIHQFILPQPATNDSETLTPLETNAVAAGGSGNASEPASSSSYAPNQDDAGGEEQAALLHLLGMAIVDSMKRFPQSSTLQGVCLDLLRRASLSDTLGSTTGSTADLPNHIVTDGDAVIPTTTPLFPQEIWEAAIAPICQAVTLFQSKVFVQLPGLAVLAWLSEDTDYRRSVWENGRPTSDYNQTRARSSTAIVDSILGVMSYHPSDPLIQCNAVATLCWLLHNPPIMSRPATTATQPLATQSTVSWTPSSIDKTKLIMIETLERYVEDASVFGNCVCLLTALPMLLSEDSANDAQQQQEQRQETRMDSAILSGMVRHSASPKVQACCFWWMHSLITAATTNLAPGMVTNAVLNRLLPFIPRIVQAMQCHMDDASLQGQGCHVLSTLADDSSGSAITATAVRRHGTVDAVLAALRRHGATDRRVQQGAAWLLIAMASSGYRRENVAATVAFGGGLHVVDAIWDGMGLAEEDDNLDVDDLEEELLDEDDEFDDEGVFF